MPTEIVTLTRELAPALRRFSERTWRRPHSDAFYRWRYDECPAFVGYGALRDGELVATATAFERPYRMRGETVTVRESFDWFCLPEYRRSGLGVRVMQRMMQDPEPITVIGGTADTRDLLPRLGFAIPASVESYALPLGPRRVAELLEARARVPQALTRAAFPLAAPILFAPRRPAPPPGGTMVPVAAASGELLALYDRAKAYGSFPMWRLDQLRWTIAGFGGVGQFALLYFQRGAELAGYTLLRVHDVPESGRVARIVDLFAVEPDGELFAWMIAETTRIAAGYRPDFVAAYSTHPALASALRAQRYRSGGAPAPIHYYSKDRTLEGPFLFGGSWGDGPILPYPEAWFDAEASADRRG